MLKDRNVKEKVFLDVSRLHALKYIRIGNDNLIHIGAAATYGDCIRNPTIRKNAKVLVQSLLTIGSPQIRNLATIAGNLGTASPAGDSIPALIVLNGIVTLQSLSGTRDVSVQHFLEGYRKTKRESNELITEIKLSRVTKGEITFFRKLGLRHANAISLASIAFWGQVAKGPKFMAARLALGAVAPTVIRVDQAEKVLIGKTFNSERIGNVARCCAQEARPISDIRASATYRKKAVEGLTRMCFLEVLDQLTAATSHLS
jgi:CO/xanthine dehydrogenase FAD-binding subunit